MDSDNDSLSEDSLTEASANIEKEEGKEVEKTDRKDKDGGGEEEEENQNVREGSAVGESKDSGQPLGGQIRKEEPPPSTGPDLEEESRLEDEGQSADRYRTSTPTLSLEEERALEPGEDPVAMESELLIADSPITLDLSVQSSHVTALSLEEGPKICRVISTPAAAPVVSPREQQEESDDEEQFFSTGNDSLEVGGRLGEEGDTVQKDEDTILEEDVEKFGSDAGVVPSLRLETPDGGNHEHKGKIIKRPTKKKEGEKKKRAEEKAGKQRGKKKEEEREGHPGDSNTSVGNINPAVIGLTDQANLSGTISMSDTTELLRTLPEGEGSSGRGSGIPVDAKPTPTTSTTTPTTTKILIPLDDDDDDDDDGDEHYIDVNVGGNTRNLEEDDDDEDDDEGCQGDSVSVPARQLHKTSDAVPRWPRGLLSELKMATKQSRLQSLGSSFPTYSSYSRPYGQRMATVDDQFLRRHRFSQSQPHFEVLSKQPIGYYLDDIEDEVSVFLFLFLKLLLESSVCLTLYLLTF